SKSGTPTMGGVVIFLSVILGIFLLTVFIIERSLDVWLLTIVFVLFGLLGFIDDFIKLFMKRSLGLPSRQKFLAQIGIGLIFYLVLLLNGIDNQLNLTIIVNVSLVYLYVLFAIFWLSCLFT